MPDLPEWAQVLIRIGAIVVVALAATQVVVIAVRRLSRRLEAGEGQDSDLRRRSKTLATVLRSALLAVVWTVAALSALGQAGVAVGPVLAAAGIVGIAIGLGAQNLFRDLLGGFFILLEGQYDVGDVIEVAGVSGTVEAVNLRTTALRALDGSRHVVPNGEVRVSTNLTKVFSRYMITLPVSYEGDVDRAVEVLRATAEQLHREARYRDLMTGPLTILGVDNYGESSVDVRAYVETVPGEQWTVGRELRRRLKIALDREGISIPYPHRQLVVRREDEEVLDKA